MPNPHTPPDVATINAAAKAKMKPHTNAKDRATALLQHTIDTIVAMRAASNAPGYTLANAQADTDTMIANMKAQLADTANSIANGVK